MAPYLWILGEFGSLSWNKAEDKILYVAEKNPPKTSSYFKEQKKSSDDKDQPTPVCTIIESLLVF